MTPDLARRDRAPFDQLTALALDTVSSPHSRRAYRAGLQEFLAWWEAQGHPPFAKATVQAYRAELEARGLAPATVNLRLTALRRLAAEAADNGLLPPELAAGIARVKGARRLGSRVGNWLSLPQAQALIDSPDASTVKGRRDRAILALLLGCAVRRAEAAALRFEQVQQRDGRWVIADMQGKGGRIRTVPMPAWVKLAIDGWASCLPAATGPVFRSINKGGRIWGEGISEKVIWQVVQEHARACQLPRLAPHDLRRTCAKLCRRAGGELEQIQFLLGHASVQTTERYLGTRQNLTDAPNDHTGLRLAATEGN